LLQKLLEAIKEAKESSITTQKGLDAATKSAYNAISGICAAIVKAENTPIKAKLDDESLKQLHDSHAQWLEQEEQKLADHNKQQETIWQKQSQRLTNIVKNNEGVWISTKLFYIVGSLFLLSIITIVLEIAFYVYFHWIL
jgi:Fe2+ transport system protein B